MGDLSIGHLQEVILHASWLWISIWCGLAFLTLALLVLMRTSWGHSNPLHKCAALSVLAHLLLAGYATTVQIVGESAPPPPPFRMSLVDGAAGGTGYSDKGQVDSHDQAAGGWDQFMSPAVAPDATSIERPMQELAIVAPRTLDLSPTASMNIGKLPTLSAPAAVAAVQPPPSQTAKPEAQPAAPIEAAPAVAASAPAGAPAPQPGAIANVQRPRSTDPADVPHAPGAKTETEPGTQSQAGSEAIGPLPGIPEPPSGLAPDGVRSKPNDQSAKHVAGATSQPGTDDAPDAISAVASATGPGTANTGGAAGSGGRDANNSSAKTGDASAEPGKLPEVYADRLAGDKVAIAESRGGSAAGESAVQAALKWLAAVQSPDGHWDAAHYGAGKETNAIDGHDRRGAGSKADSGITGMALLAFLGAGNTHLQGKHAVTVQHGLEYLISIQAPNGNLGGSAEVYSFMYCHGISTFALSEAYAMTGDKRLEKPLRAALAYTLSAQHPTTGGWRYQPQETGDTSQLGWQLMALKSAELSGIEMPSRTRDGMVRFLRSVSSGRAAGLGSYRPGERPSRTMTAEALLCRQFLGVTQAASTEEAADFVMSELPGDERPNLYYWYYGTLSMYQVQGPRWQRWTESLQATLLKQQETAGDAVGSWKPDAVWGGYGGRVYSTAMSALCLEVYYRYLPIYGGQRPAR